MSNFRTGALIGFLSAAVIGLAVALIVVSRNDATTNGSSPPVKNAKASKPKTGGPSDAVDAGTSEVVYWKQRTRLSLPGGGESLVEPSQIIVISDICSGCGYRLVDLEWRGWGTPDAQGSGRAVPVAGPGTCGWPPVGCEYPYQSAEVYLSGISGRCGELRYMTALVSVDGGEKIGWPYIDCEGIFHPTPTGPSGVTGVYE